MDTIITYFCGVLINVFLSINKLSLTIVNENILKQRWGNDGNYSN